VKNRFRSLPFKCNLQRYSEAADPAASADVAAVLITEAGLCTLESS
jgi:hypothetical protein